MQTKKEDLRSLIVSGENVIQIQSNRITNSKLEFFTLRQKILFYWIIYNLQPAIKADMNKSNFTTQLELFTDKSKNTYVKINIPYHYFAKRQNYDKREVKGTVINGLTEEILGLMNLRVFLEVDKKENMDRISNFIVFADIPKNKENSRAPRYANVYLLPEVAEKLIKISRNAKDQPAYYTQYFLNTILEAKNKYLPEIYILLSAWKDTGIFRINYRDLKERLSLGPDNYREFRQFKHKVLKPIAEELKSKADIWFDPERHDFAVANGKDITLNFTIMTYADTEKLQMQLSNILNLCERHLGFKQKDREALATALHKAQADLPFVQEEIIRLNDYLKTNTKDAEGGKINNIPAYVISSIKKSLKLS